METEAHPLEYFFQKAVRASFVEKVGVDDPEIIDYVAHMLCEFSEPDSLHRLKDDAGNPIDTVAEMLRAADPIYGTANSFDQERSIRRYVGDYAMFMAGMHLDVMASAPHYETDRPIAEELIRVGRESYFVVSQFNVFEFQNEAPLFGRLAECLERCVIGLAVIREELGDRRFPNAGQS